MWHAVLFLGSLLRQAVDYERDGCLHDLLGDTGLCYAIRQVLRIEESGLAFWALPCNSFAWLSSSQHERGPQNPFGCGSYHWVQAGNILGARTSLLLCLCIARQVKWMLENPEGSAVRCFPYLQHVLSFPEVLPQRIMWWGPHHSVIVHVIFVHSCAMLLMCTINTLSWS